MKARLLPSIAAVVLASVWVRPALAQTAPDEHAQHHPAPGGGAPAPMSPAGPVGMPMAGGGAAATGATTMAPDGSQMAPDATGAMPGSQTPMAPGGAIGAGASMTGTQPPAPAGGGMAAMMGEMMKQMGTPPRKELYPSLMALPDEVTPEDRFRIEQQAHERMTEGATRLYSSLSKLSASTSDEDFAVMQEATGQMREGLAEFEAGIAARRVLSEGKVARNLALSWFKREMNLASPVTRQGSGLFSGVTAFHLFTMVLLVAFALAMVAVYFFKMRRAAALFGRLEVDANSPPPPGAAPPLAGTPAPPAPVTQPSGGPPDGGSANVAG